MNFGELGMRIFLVGLICLLLVGCGQTPLYTKLSEQQANEMLSALNAAGVTATKANEDGGTWQIQTTKNDFAPALAALRAQGLPRDEFATLGTVFKKEGFVSSPLEEHARLMFGLSQELSHTLASIDGVIVARVHLAMPENDPLSDKPKSAAASVFIKYRPDVDLTKQIGQIKALVVNSVEGLPYDNVTVMLFPAQTASVGPKEAPPSLSNNIVIGGIAVIGLLGALTGMTFIRQWFAKRTPLAAPSIPAIEDAR